MKPRNYRKEVVKVLRDIDFDNLGALKAIIFKIAEAEPRVLVQVIRDGGVYHTVDTLIRARQKIHAIKELRSLTGWSLVDSKNWVEARERELKI